MTTKTIGTILIIILLIGCQTKKGVEQNEVDNADTVLTADKVVQTSESTDSTKTEENFDTSDCIRGQAEPILKKDKFPNSSFKINEDGLSGTETTDLKNGDKLIIINGGCEYYVLAFRFETSRFQGDTTDINFWASKIVDFMTEISDGIDAPIDLKKGTKALNEYIKLNQIQILEDVTFEPGEIRTYLNIDRIQKIDNKNYGLEISYIVGPL
jgi:hypothetical protein